MTKKEKIEKIETIIKNNGFTLDKWDNWKNEKYRIKIKSINIRIEKSMKRTFLNNTQTIWFNIKSEPIIYIKLDEFDYRLNKINKEIKERKKMKKVKVTKNKVTEKWEIKDNWVSVSIQVNGHTIKTNSTPNAGQIPAIVEWAKQEVKDEIKR